MNDNKHDLSAALSYYGARVPDRTGWVSIKCPFHNDAQASAAVNLRDQVFDCFVCDIYGDVYTIIMHQEGIKFKDAIARAETITNGNRSKVSQPYRRKDSLLPPVKGNNKRGGRFIPSRYSL
jgi:DNA primase